MNHYNTDDLKNYYCILISRYLAPLYKSYIQEGKPVNEHIKILTPLSNLNLACIVIPKTSAFKAVERNLRQFYTSNNHNGGFWGQLGINVSYSNVTWTEL